MKKLILWFGLVGIAFISSFSQTTITSNITTNTTWDVAGSPYLITQPINIAVNTTLTIDPGVDVIIDSINITVYGNIFAVGTVTDSIRFLSSIGVPSSNVQYGFKWLGFQILSGDVTMDYVYGEFANKFLNYQYYSGVPTPTISHSTFRENRSAIHDLDGPGAGLLIDHCTFIQCRYPITGNNLLIENCVFDKFDMGVNIDKGHVHNSTFIDNINFSIQLKSGDIQNNHFYETPAAIASNVSVRLNFNTTNGNILIKNNKFNNSYGLSIIGYPLSQLTVINNEFCTDSTAIFAYSDPVLDVSNNCWCTTDSIVIDNKIKGINGFPAVNTVFMPIDSSCVPSQVYPGDANHDQIANNVDLLPIGLHFGKTGPARINPTLNWVGQDADAWGDSLASTGVDIKHVDTNGDGMINDDDTLAVNLNYGMTHTANRHGEESTSGYDLYFDMPTNAFNPGDSIAIGVMLGTVDTPAVNLYGLAFSVDFDSSLIEPGSMKVSYDSSWLGDKGLDMITLDKEFFNDEVLDMALSRTNQMNRMGYGKIAEIIVVIDDDIYKQSLPFVMNFSNIYAISADGSVIEVAGEQGIGNVEPEDTSSTNGIFQPIDNQISIYPSPANERLVIASNDLEINSIQLKDIQGRTVFTRNLNREMKTTLEVGDLSEGIYIVLIQAGDAWLQKKVMIKR